VASALLVLFDIDGTLVAGATDAHRDAMHEALRSVHSVDAVRAGRLPISPAGRTDPEIARSILLAAGISAERIDDRADAVHEACCRAYARLCPSDLGGTVLPGVGGLLEWLSGRPEQVTLGLVTGNYETIGRLKLARAGLGKYFSGAPGGFGSDAEDRAALPGIARRRAGTLGRPHPRERTIVIGDTPRDIACARADGVRCAAVTTGLYGAGELSSADAVASDAAELRALIEHECQRVSVTT
jgi:phosphoglycolate phosphatase-like HAD superfamily hydrolase